MEFEDIVKRVQWLDDQQRKSKTELTELTGRLASLGTSVNALTQQIKTLNQQTHDFSVAAARIEQFDEIIVKHRADVAKMVEPIEKNAVKREQEILRLQRTELEDLRKSIFEIRSTITSDEAAKRNQAHEEQRRTLALQDMRSAMDALIRQTKDVQDAQKTLDEAQRQETKRLADLQGELAAVRKRTDEAREKVAVHSDGLRNVENRLSELAQVDNTRQEQHAALIQQQALAQVERDRAWKEWQERYEGFKKQAVAMENQVSAFEDAIRAAQKAQEAYDGLNQRLERRIAEVGEVQRLAEERIRQEWVAFKADEQKRWTGHSLSQDESIRDLRKDVDKIAKGITALDDAAQTTQDQLHQTTEATEQQLQELMNVTQEWLSAYERIMGHAKTKVKKAVR